MPSQNVPIQTLLHEVQTGEIVLPDFQRPFVWQPDDVKDFLVSILGDYYVGTMLYMDAYQTDSPFALRLIAGVEELFPQVTKQNFVKILLDGQQRTSALFYALSEPPIPLYSRRNPYLFFVHLPSLLQNRWEQTIEFVNAGNKRTLRTLTQSLDHFPLKSFRDAGHLSTRILESKYKDQIAEILKRCNAIMTYQVQMIHLARDTPLDRVVETFERINRTGLPLSVTDLLVAKLYKDGIKLRNLIEEATEHYSFLDPDNRIDVEYILRVVALLRGADVRRRAILELNAECFVTDWTAACRALEVAYKHITDTKDGYGAAEFARWTPFASALVTLGAMIAFVERSSLPEAPAFKRIDEWYWATVFGNRYNEAVNTNIVADYEKMKAWFVDEAGVPDFITRFDPIAVDLRVENRSSAIFKGVMCLVAKRGAYDFQTGKPPHLAPRSVEDDHIFPKRYKGADVVVNRTIISSNQRKSDKEPSRYFGALKELNGDDALHAILATHYIDANATRCLLNDEFEEFCLAREAQLREVIKSLVPHAAPHRQL
jgi:hypothetical protein